MAEEEGLTPYEVTPLQSLPEYHRRRRAEAQVAAIEQVRMLEAERSARRWAVAHAAAETIAEHPVAAVGVGLVGLWLLSAVVSSQRNR